jgi:hypothetical protein
MPPIVVRDRSHVDPLCDSVFQQAPKTQPYWRVFYPGERDSADPRVLDAGSGQQIELPALVLPPPLPERVLSGRVHFADGSPAAAAWVYALPANTVHYGGQSRTDADGRYSLILHDGVQYGITARAVTGPERAMWSSAEIRLTLNADRDGVIVTLRPRPR